jgi:hypothetical protein
MSEPEPIYEYVRGTGWVPYDGSVVTLKCGTKVRVETRLPQNGERYWAIWHSSTVEREYGLTVEGISRWLTDTWFSNASYCNVSVEEEDARFKCFVLVPV